MLLRVEFERETDGRWIADVIELPGVLAYGESRDEAFENVKRLALRVLVDKREHREVPPFDDVSFSPA